MITLLKPHWIGPQYSEINRDWEMPFLALKKLPIVVGLTGPARVGKTMVAKRLVTEHGFHYESMSTFLRDMAHMLGRHRSYRQELGKERDAWKKLTEVSQILRQEMGADVIARMVLDRISQLREVECIVVDGILHPADVQTLRGHTDFVLVGMAASTDARVREAVRWYAEDEAHIQQDLEQRDRFENYDYEEFKRQRNTDDMQDVEAAIQRPALDVLACLKLVEREHLIDLGNKPFNVETIFKPADDIVHKLLKDARDEY
jgi:dephospho-CoA kinase